MPQFMPEIFHFLICMNYFEDEAACTSSLFLYAEDSVRGPGWRGISRERENSQQTPKVNNPKGLGNSNWTIWSLQNLFL